MSLFATYRPASGDIGVIVSEGGATARVDLTIAEARDLRDTLDGALQLAAQARDPVSAVAGGTRAGVGAGQGGAA